MPILPPMGIGATPGTEMKNATKKAGILRRDFLKTAPLAAGLMTQSPVTAASISKNVIEAFDYKGVSLRDSRWRQQVLTAREFYLGLSDDDILHGFRAAAGLP